MKISWLASAAVAMLSGVNLGLAAAEPAKAPAAATSIALYQGADRHERLVAAAQKEGELTVYHVYPSLTMVMAAFTKKYGIKIKPWRAGSEAVLQRVVTEARGSRYDVDIVQNNAPENEAMHRERLSQEVWSPYLVDLMPHASPPHKEWVGITVDVFTAAYNTRLIKKEDLPKSYSDLLDPRWKNRLAIETDDIGWFGTLIEALGEQQGRKLFTDIVAANGMTFRKGHSLLGGLVASGDAPIALSAYSWTAEQLKRKGAPIENHVLQPLIGQFSTLAMAKRAPHPNAAALFYDYMLNEGQQQLASLDYVVTRKKIESPFSNVPLKLISPEQALDLQEKWAKLFDEVLIKAAR